MNYRKLLFFSFLASNLAFSGAFGMQKQGQYSDYKNQALSWIFQYKTEILVSSGLLLAGYGLYKYFTKPEALATRIKKNKADLEQALKEKFFAMKNDARYIVAHGGIRALTLQQNNGYVAGYVMVKSPESPQYKFLVIFQDKADRQNLIAYRFSGQNLEQASPKEIEFLQAKGLLQPQNLIVS